MPESDTPIALSLVIIDRNLVRRRHLIAQLFFAGRRKTKDLLPHFARFHAQIDFHRWRSAANPANHLAVHLYPERLIVSQLAIGTEHLFAGEQSAARKTLAHGPFQA